MKYHYFFITNSFLFSLAICSCNKSLNFERIKVGMTYNEVEGLVGKPSVIDRGAKELKLDVDDLSLSELALINPQIRPNLSEEEQKLEVLRTKVDIARAHLARLQEPASANWGDSTVADLPRWVAPYHVKTVGQLLYVTWVFQASKVDTHYVLRGGHGVESTTESTNIPENKPRASARISDRTQFLVTRFFNVIFDASSGRVVLSGYYPMTVSQLE